MKLEPVLRVDVSIAVGEVAQRTWQRKWRDVLHARQSLADAYGGNRLDVDDLNRRVEGFFKTCRELGDWIQESTGAPARDHVKKEEASSLKVCDAIAQTAKHFKRDRSDAITAIVVKLYSDQKGINADVEWNSNAGVSGRDDALALADRCIDEWREFFPQHNLDPNI